MRRYVVALLSLLSLIAIAVAVARWGYPGWARRAANGYHKIDWIRVWARDLEEANVVLLDEKSTTLVIVYTGVRSTGAVSTARSADGGWTVGFTAIGFSRTFTVTPGHDRVIIVAGMSQLPIHVAIPVADFRAMKDLTRKTGVSGEGGLVGRIESNGPAEVASALEQAVGDRRPSRQVQ